MFHRGKCVHTIGKDEGRLRVNRTELTLYVKRFKWGQMPSVGFVFGKQEKI